MPTEFSFTCKLEITQFFPYLPDGIIFEDWIIMEKGSENMRH